MKISATARVYPDTERQNTDLWTDSEGKEVRNQIAAAKCRLKELSADKALNEEEREKKQKELQQKITDLNNQLRQRRLELHRRQQEQRKSAAVPDEDGSHSQSSDPPEDSPKAAVLPETGARAIFAASSAVGSAKSQGSLAASLESRVRILQGEIKQDEERGLDTRFKQDELERLEKKAARLNGFGSSSLAKASANLKQALEQEIRPGQKNNSDGFVRLIKSPLSSAPKSKTDIYLRGDMFSHVDFHF